MARLRIAPSMLSCDFGRVGEEIREIEKAGADWLHVDVMDGHFVPNITVGPPVVRAMRKNSSLFFDVHLMIDNPLKHVASFAEAGADLINFHIEVEDEPGDVIAEIRRLGKKVGVAVKPKTSVDSVKEILDRVDMVLVMSVEPGFGGQRFMPEVLPKLTELRKLMGPEADIQIDGGIDENRIVEAANAGANIFVAGTAVFGNENRTAAIAALREGALRGAGLNSREC